MKTFDASLYWERGAQTFLDQRYSRAHTWQFDGGLVADRYRDDATGFLDKDEQGRLAIVRIVQRRRIAFAGTQPDAAVSAALHHEAHARCYIASSLRGEVVIEGDA